MSRQTKNSKSRVEEAIPTAADTESETKAKPTATQKSATKAKPTADQKSETEAKSTKDEMADDQNVDNNERAQGPQQEQPAQGVVPPANPAADPTVAMLVKQVQDMQAHMAKQEAETAKREAQMAQKIAQNQADLQRQLDAKDNEAQRKLDQERNETQRQRDQERFEMQKKLDDERHEMRRRLDAEQNEKKELEKELARRENTGPKNYGKAPKFDLEKDRENFETWKLKWEDFLISSSINAIPKTAVKDEQTKAALTAALSDDTLKWINGQGFSPDDLKNATFIIGKIDEHIQGTTNPYVQVIELIGRKKSPNESFDHFMTDLNERSKRCALEKVKNVPDWFVTMIVVANHNDPDVRKKLLLQKDLKLDTAKAICREEEKAAKTSQMLGASRASQHENYGASQAQQESAAAVSGYQASRGRGRGQFRGRGGHHGDRNFQQQDRGRSQSRGRSESRQRSNSRDGGGTCYR